ncbi:MAG: hypothetical protein JKY48_15765 [Flavobacteriales bacterium]|nr:hypothetical protein [Flavobacteriales bacterium]
MGFSLSNNDIMKLYPYLTLSNNGISLSPKSTATEGEISLESEDIHQENCKEAIKWVLGKDMPFSRALASGGEELDIMAHVINVKVLLNWIGLENTIPVEVINKREVTITEIILNTNGEVSIDLDLNLEAPASINWLEHLGLNFIFQNAHKIEEKEIACDGTDQQNRDLIKRQIKVGS